MQGAQISNLELYASLVRLGMGSNNGGRSAGWAIGAPRVMLHAGQLDEYIEARSPRRGASARGLARHQLTRDDTLRTSGLELQI